MKNARKCGLCLFDDCFSVARGENAERQLRWVSPGSFGAEASLLHDSLQRSVTPYTFIMLQTAQTKSIPIRQQREQVSVYLSLFLTRLQAGDLTVQAVSWWGRQVLRTH